MTIRADFNFSDETEQIRECKGYVIGEFTPTAEGGDFKPEKTILERLVAVSPDFEKIEQLAIKYCKVIYDDSEVKNIGSVADYHD